MIGPFKGTELYASAGVGFHSSDARGITITRDPKDGKAGARGRLLKGTIAGWQSRRDCRRSLVGFLPQSCNFTE